jgi:hypothetical protein
MKTTLILLTIIFAAAWAGCSDNMNITDPLGGNNSNVQNQPNHPTDLGNGTPIWSLDELKVWTVSEDIAENKAVYNNPPPVPPSTSTRKYMISFDVSTNAEKTTNGYSPLAKVYKDRATMYSESDFTSSGETSVHKEIYFRGDFSQIKFYVALFKTDTGGNSSIPNNSVQLTLENINIFRIK